MSDTAWIAGDVDFDLPCITYTLNFRSKLGREFYKQVKVLGDYPKPEECAKVISDFLVGVLPNLKGHILAAMSMDLKYMQWQFHVLHSCLSVRKFGEAAKEQRLERCPICETPLPMTECFQRVWKGESVEICSEECLMRDDPTVS